MEVEISGRIVVVQLEGLLRYMEAFPEIRKSSLFL